MKKKTMKRNQLIIGALTVLLGVAGYINFSGNKLDLAPGELEPTESAFAEEQTETDAKPAEIVSGELTVSDVPEDEYIELNSEEEKIGEAVLTSANAANNFVSIKLNREKSLIQNKETLLEIINGDGMDAQAVQAATDAYVKLTEDAEKEQEAESILAAKGFGEAIVSIGDSGVDVILNCTDLPDEKRAQVEDVVTRKTGCTVDAIVITLAQ